MKTLETLIWLEFRKSAGWLMALVGILAVAVWFVMRVQDTPIAATPSNYTSLGLRFLYLSLAGMAGVVVLLLGMVFTSRQDGTLLLLSIPNGAQHQWVRLAFYGFFGSLFLLALSSMFWWALDRAQIRMGLSSMWYLAIYGLVSLWLPVVGAVLLTRQVNLSFALGRLAWLSNLVMLVGLANLATLAALFLNEVAYVLPALPLPDVSAYGLQIDRILGSFYALNLASELPLLGLGCTLLLVWLAGRIWDEVEA